MIAMSFICWAACVYKPITWLVRWHNAVVSAYLLLLCVCAGTMRRHSCSWNAPPFMHKLLPTPDNSFPHRSIAVEPTAIAMCLFLLCLGHSVDRETAIAEGFFPFVLATSWRCSHHHHHLPAAHCKWAPGTTWFLSIIQDPYRCELMLLEKEHKKYRRLFSFESVLCLLFGVDTE